MALAIPKALMQSPKAVSLRIQTELLSECVTLFLTFASLYHHFLNGIYGENATKVVFLQRKQYLESGSAGNSGLKVYGKYNSQKVWKDKVLS